MDPDSDQAGRPSRGRVDEVGRYSGVVSQRADLHRRDLQDGREDYFLHGCLAERLFGASSLSNRCNIPSLKSSICV